MLMTPLRLMINTERLRHQFDALAHIGALGRSGGVSRVAFSGADIEARNWFAACIDDAALDFRDDEVGNVSGILRSSNPDAQTLLIGSHLDTPRIGGRFDGSVGVLAGLECARTLREAGVALPFHLEVIDFTDEEGTWYSLFGSSGLTGVLPNHLLDNGNSENGAIHAALELAGLKVSEIRRARRTRETLKGYLELHIEQGDHLENTHHAIGVVTRIVGRSSFVTTFHGEAVHAATNYARKRDALQGAACFIMGVHNLPREIEGGMVNCGNLEVQPGATTIVPSLVRVNFEVRHAEPNQLALMEQQVNELAQRCAREFNLTAETQCVLRRNVAHMDERMLRQIESVCQQQGYSHTRLVSFAGHDAQLMAPFTPSAMIFIPCKDGISMNPREYTDWQHVEQGANVLLHTILSLAEQHP